jgi:hypothetical protein
MKKKYALLLLIIPWLCSLSFTSYAQEDTTRQDKEYANPSVEGNPRGRFLIFRYERQFNYDFTSRAHHLNVPDPTNKEVKIDHSNIAEIKGFIPLFNNPHFKAILGVSYEREEFNFNGTEGSQSNFLFHQNMQDKGLKSLSAQLAFLHPLNYTNFLTWRFKGQLNGDYTAENEGLNPMDYFRSTAEIGYGWKKNKNLAYGIGLQFGYTYGRKSVLPAILYNQTFNDHWGIESVFPAAVKMRYRASDKTYFYGGYNVEGYSYVIGIRKPPFENDPAFRNLESVELRHNDLKAHLRWEQEIYDFLWFSLEGGYRHNLAYDVFEEGTKRDTKLIKIDVGGAPYAQAEIYFVVPKAFLKR